MEKVMEKVMEKKERGYGKKKRFWKKVLERKSIRVMVSKKGYGNKKR